MKAHHTVGKATVILIGALACLAAATADPVYAQAGGSRPTPVERRIDQANRDGEEYERDSLNRELKGVGDKPVDRRRAQTAAAQVTQDFENLQVRYNQIVLAMASRQDLNQDSILGAVAEVNRCATRLKLNLALPRPKSDEDQQAKSDPGLGQVEEPLLILTKRIYSFVTNPLFETPAVLNVKHVGRARRDLDAIIELSESIGKGGDKLKRPIKS